MIDAGEPVTFPAVARRAGVSVSLLYADSELAGRLSKARSRQRDAGADRAWRLPARSLVSEQSLRADLAKQQNPKDHWTTRHYAASVATLEDKIVQRAVAGVLNAVYEADFLGFSYGFRPGRGSHQALDAPVAGIYRRGRDRGGRHGCPGRVGIGAQGGVDRSGPGRRGGTERVRCHSLNGGQDQRTASMGVPGRAAVQIAGNRPYGHGLTRLRRCDRVRAPCGCGQHQHDAPSDGTAHCSGQQAQPPPGHCAADGRVVKLTRCSALARRPPCIRASLASITV